MTRICLPFSLALFLAACAQPEYEIVSRTNSSRPSPEIGYDGALQSIAFDVLKGMSRPEARAFLERDGFSCAGSDCMYYSEKKLSTADVVFGISAPQDRVIGARRAYRQTFLLTLTADRVETPGDILADARFEAGAVPWHRSPRPSDFKVTHD